MINKEYTINYMIKEDILQITLFEKKGNKIICKVASYNLCEIDNKVTFYNRLLDDFNCEYNNELSNMFDMLVEDITSNVNLDREV